MGAQESKRWLELPPDTPQQHKRVGQLKELEDPRSPGMAPRTPIQLQEYDESPQNREIKINIPDPRSPTPLIDRTPIVVEARKNSKSRKSASTKEAVETVAISQPFPQEKNARNIPEETISPGAPLSKKDQARLLKKTTSPGDFKRQRRLSQRQSVPQKLFTDKVGPAPRSPLTQRNSIDLGEAGLKKNKAVLTKSHGSNYIELGSGKENTVTPVVF